MSKKGPRSDAYHVLTASLSDEVMARYLEIAHHVREQEKARRREAERRKAAEKKKREALLMALFGWKPPKKAKRKKKSKFRGKKKPETVVAQPPSISAVGAETAGAVAPEAAAVKAILAAGEGEGLATEAPAAADPIEAEAVVTGAAVGSEADPAPDPQTGSEKEADSEAETGPPAVVAKAHPGGSRQAKPITREEILKLLVADDLGYLEKVRTDGWGGLSCAESGRVGGMMTRRMKQVERGLRLFEG